MIVFGKNNIIDGYCVMFLGKWFIEFVKIIIIYKIVLWIFLKNFNDNFIVINRDKKF